MFQLLHKRDVTFQRKLCKIVFSLVALVFKLSSGIRGKGFSNRFLFPRSGLGSLPDCVLLRHTNKPTHRNGRE